MLIVLVSCCLPLSLTQAIGLGEAILHSYLNDPLRVEIPVVDLKQVEASQLRVTVATIDEYQKLGIARDPCINGIELSLQQKRRGTVNIYAHSVEPMVDPVINLIILLVSPEGKLIRNYTLFFDPPGYREIQQAVVPSNNKPPQLARPFLPETSPQGSSATLKQSATLSHNPGSKTAAISAKPTQSVASTNSKGELMSINNGVYGPTQLNQTLWNVAKQISPRTPGNMFQVTWALYTANPDAFAYDNINGLKAGSYLRVPNKQTILNVNTLKARTAIQTQQRDWQQLLQRPTTAAGVANIKKTNTMDKDLSMAIDTAADKKTLQPISNSSRDALTNQSATTVPAQRLGVSDGQIKSTEQSTKDIKEVVTQPNEVRKLRASLAASADALTSEKQKNQVLVDRVETLNSEIAELENAIEQTRKQIKILQENPQVNQSVSSSKTLESTSTAAKQSPAVTMKSASSSEELEEASTAAKQSPAVTVESVPANLKTVKLNIKSEKTDQAVLPVKSVTTKSHDNVAVTKTNILFMSVGLVVLIVAVCITLIWRRQRKRRHGRDAQQYFHSTHIDESDEAETDHLFEDDEFSESEDISSDSISAPSIDVKEEVSVFIAYGRYEKAIKLLEQAILADPNDVELKVLLLQCFAKTKDYQKFEAVREQLPADLAETDVEAWQTIDNLIRHTVWEDNLTPSSDTKALEDLVSMDTDESHTTPEETHVIDFDHTQNEKQMMDDELTLANDSEPDAKPERSVTTKLDLARVYIEMDDIDEARELLESVIQEGDADQKSSAQAMLDKLD